MEVICGSHTNSLKTGALRQLKFKRIVPDRLSGGMLSQQVVPQYASKQPRHFPGGPVWPI
jgi:hypothetical protein